MTTLSCLPRPPHAWLRSRGRRGAAQPGGRSGVQRRRDHRHATARRTPEARRSWPSRNWACRPTPATTCSTRRHCSTAARPRSPQWSRASTRTSGRWRSSACRCGSTTGCTTARRSVAGGRLLGVLPKTYLPNYGEFYEGRQFSAADEALATEVDLCGQRVPFGTELLFQCRQHPLLKLHVEICEDVWVPIPPSSYAALAGATVLVNLSASNITIGKAGVPAPAGEPAFGALPGGLPVFVGRHRRVDHRPGLGRPGADLRKRRACWPRASASAIART